MQKGNFNKAASEYRRSIGILSLGCPRNLVDSEIILAGFAKKGHTITDIDKADIAIVNTCAFIEDAKTESIDAILDLADLKRQGRIKKILVYGCLSQRYGDKLRRQLPEVDAFVGKISFPSKGDSRLGQENQQPCRFSLTPKHYAYIKICEGCINNCSYCIIPKIKGRFASLDMDSVFRKIGGLDKDKISEIDIIGQDITGYGIDLYGSARLPELLKGIIKRSKNIGWVRLLYLYPSRVDDELLDLMLDEPKICRYLDLPLQHINNRILKLMRRATTKEEILRLIEKIRKKIPGAAIRTSVIAGFPSETEQEFQELLGFIKEIKFERLGAFIYSREEGTAAHNFKNQVPHSVKVERFDAIMSEQQKVSEEINKGFLGRDIDVLIDRKEGPSSYLGRSQYDAPEVDGIIYVNSERRLNPGDFVRVKVIDTLEYDLVGEAVSEYCQ